MSRKWLLEFGCFFTTRKCCCFLIEWLCCGNFFLQTLVMLDYIFFCFVVLLGSEWNFFFVTFFFTLLFSQKLRLLSFLQPPWRGRGSRWCRSRSLQRRTCCRPPAARRLQPRQPTPSGRGSSLGAPGEGLTWKTNKVAVMNFSWGLGCNRSVMANSAAQRA